MKTYHHVPLPPSVLRPPPSQSVLRPPPSLFILLGFGLTIGLYSLSSILFAEPAPQTEQEALQKMFNDGNYKDAYEGYNRLALDPQANPRQVGNHLAMAINCLNQLGRLDEVDEFRESVIKIHEANWRLLAAAADTYLTTEHHGYVVAGAFERGYKRGEGHLVNALARDRVRALQLLVLAMPLAQKDDDHPAVAEFYLTFARALLAGQGYSEAWRLQAITDLDVLPDYDDGWYQGRQSAGAPVDADGNPVFHRIPASFEQAASDGERWRWALAQSAEMSPQTANRVRWELATFLQSQFGEQTMAYYGVSFGPGLDEAAKENDAKDKGPSASGTYALHTLAETETIARLASGVRRFELPDEFNYIKIFQQIADQPETGYGEQAVDALAQIFENRRQYPTAAKYWRRGIQQYGPGPEAQRQHRLDQVVGNWGQFETASTQPAGKGATIEFRFRNARQAHFEAHAVRVEDLLEDVKAYLRGNPENLEWERLNIADIGYGLIAQQQQKYVGKQVATWDLELEPRAEHFDKRITITTPLQKAGAYLLTARLDDGNTSRVLLWLADTVLIKKPMGQATLYYVADAVNGKPVAKANVEVFGYLQRHVGGNRYRVETVNFAEFTDADGQLAIETLEKHDNYAWLVLARTRAGRLAYLGFTNVWRQAVEDPQYEAVKVFAITDRPVYRPKQTVQFKFWVRHTRYDAPDESSFAGQQFKVEIHSPKGEKVYEQQFQADAYGGFDGTYELPEDAPLGIYQAFVVDRGGGSFRVEEYKKPEYEVTVEAPAEPVMLGEKVQALIQAKYYFGAPVAQATVKYKVLRTSVTQSWYPIGPWDWFYGRGYGWFGYDYDWYPGWRRWGAPRPMPWWWGRSGAPPEIVADAQVEIGPDGTVPIEIDTALAQALHPDQDHQYEIVAEVVDQSRRTIVGTGKVLVARRPFSVFVWVDRGYYSTGDVVRMSASAHTLNDRPVIADGKLTLLRITYDDKRKPVETPVEEWDLPTGEDGQAQLEFEAAEAGQYRLSYRLTDSAGREQEGGYLFTVMGEGAESRDFRFSSLELIPDQREYRPGDNVHLQVNTARAGGTVLLFVRPVSGIYKRPRTIRLDGKSTIVDIEVTRRDMPNFFVEAMTVSGGRVYTEARQIPVPPEQRVLQVAVEPSATEYRPGQPAEVKLTLADWSGKPFVGSAVLAIYDKAVEYISGGSNVPEIREFFWKWRRDHYPQTESSLDRYSYNLVKPGDPAMQDLGVFGHTVADEMDDKSLTLFAKRAVGGVRMRMELESAAMPAAAAEGAEMADGLAVGNGRADAGQAPLVTPTVRTNFADTALWVGSLTTDGDGVATVRLDMPENLTTWKVRVWSMGHGTKVGQGEAEVITNKNLLVRIQAPRFFVQTDEVVLSANVHNYLATSKRVEVSLELDGPVLAATDGLARTIEVEAGAESRVDWRVRVEQEGQAIVRMKALTDEESDAVEMSFPAYVHGMEKVESFAGAILPDEVDGQFAIRVPNERRPEQTRLEVRYSPTLAGAMVDALPFLVDYPYGCTEQTLNRFLPTVITQRILLDMRLDLKDIRDKRTNLNAQEIGDDRQRAAGWKRFDRNPVFDPDEVRRMVKESVQRLTDMQLGDGGWGWFSGWGEHSYAHTTAYVVHGLQIAQQNDVALVPGMLDRGLAWLRNYQQNELRMLKNAVGKVRPYKLQADNLDALVYMVLADAGEGNLEMQDFLYRDRTHLSAYAKAMFALALHVQGQEERLTMLRRNIEQFVEEDEENQTAWLRLPQNNAWWYWFGDEVEANSYYLKLLARVDPKGRTASRLVKYLLNNRKHATYWNSTRDTAVAIEALAEYLKASGESAPDMTVEVWLDGQKQNEVRITQDNLFTFDNQFVLAGDALAEGEHTVELKKQGTGPLYYNGYLTNFTLEEHITRAGLELKVNRKYYKLVREDRQVDVAGSRGQAAKERVERYRREEIDNLGELISTDLVEVELEIDSKNDYEYLMFEDPKAAGFEPVDIQSGYAGNDLGAYVELRDERVVFFVRSLARGKHSVAYRLRAETPGRFSALPTRASAMYAPELRGNSDEIKVLVNDG